MEDYIIQFITWAGMSGVGLLTGAVGALLSLFIVNGNTLTWRRSAAILLAGIAISAYSHDPLVEWLGIEGLASIINIVIGFLAADILSSLKDATPSITLKLIRRFLGSTDEKPKDNGS